jgi:hypothetical protein
LGGERSYDLAKLNVLDLFLSYWAGPEMAHLIMSFGFDDGQQFARSMGEAREERNTHPSRTRSSRMLSRSVKIVQTRT